MGTLCLSSALILRCESLSRIESVVVLIPPALGLVFALTLVVAKWNSGRRHLLLAAEGFVYFVLSLLDFLSHILPAAQHMKAFKVLDIIIGASSFIPLSSYTIFLFLFARNDLIPQLPLRFQRIAMYFLFLFIPATVILNELAGFLGVSYRNVPISPNSSTTVLAIGFADVNAQTLWTFFTSFTLALLTVYQALAFVLTFYRIVKALVDQRRIEASGTEETERRLFNGVGWLALGTKLGAIETVIGFADGGFGLFFTRRLLRLLARACLTIGVIKGMDLLEDFQLFRNESNLPQTRSEKRDIRALISNPRGSTFLHMSPTATTFHQIPRAVEKARLGPSKLSTPMDPGSSAPKEPGVNARTIKRTPSDRVTVHYAVGEAPTLDVRFSALDLPSPTEMVEEIKSRPVSPQTIKSYGAYSIANTTGPMAPMPSPVHLAEAMRAAASPARPESAYSYTPPRISNGGLWRDDASVESFVQDGYGDQEDNWRADSHRATLLSMKSGATSESLSVVHRLATQFPSLPPRVAAPRHRDSAISLPIADGGPDTSSSPTGLVRGNTVHRKQSLTKRKPAPSLLETDSAALAREVRMKAAMEAMAITPAADDGQGQRTVKDPYSAVTSPSTPSSAGRSYGSSHNSASVGTPNTEAFGEQSTDHHAKTDSGLWLADGHRQGVAHQSTADSVDELRGRVVSESTLDIPWLQTTETIEEEEVLTAERTYQIKARPSLVRLKSVGKVQNKRTPTPTHVGFSRESIAIERHGSDGKIVVHPDLVPRMGPRVDSGVLGEDDKDYVLQATV